MKNRPLLSLLFVFVSTLAIMAGALLLLQPVAVARAVAPSATITVNSAADSATAGDGLCTLREALTNANTNGDSSGGDCVAGSGTDVVTFAIGAFETQQTITLTGNLPTISDPVILDAWTQGGADYTGPPLIEISGANLNSGGDRGFRVDAGGTTIRGFVINRFDAPSGAAVWLRKADGNWIAGNYIGVGTDGATPLPNYYGIWIDNWGSDEPSDENIIGTNGDGINDLFEGNVIGAAIQEKIRVESSGNWIAGNHIGTNASGDAAAGSGGTAIRLYGTNTTIGDDNLIGTNGDGVSDDVEGNLISGNDYGIGINNSSGHTIAGNIIGLDAAGAAIIGNDFNGIDCNASATNSRDILIGTNNDGVSDGLEGNVISGNGSRGYSTFYNNCRHITISGNKVGTNISGTVALGNGAEGIIISAGDWYTITNNIISGNGTNGTAAGITTGSGANNITIAENIIGSDADGSVDLGNTGDGIELQFSDNYAIRDNQIGGNGSEGIMVNAGDAILIQENLIGVESDGNSALSNDGHGVYMFGDAQNNTVISNTIAYGGLSGIVVDSNQAISNTLSANQIFANADFGIDLDLDGKTINDEDDLDTGPNGLQNYPEIVAVTNTVDNIIIEGVLDSTPSTSFTLEFFTGAICDDALNNQGTTYLGSGAVTTLAGGGNANDTSFSITLPAFVPQGRFLVTTATGPEGTSEFSTCFGPTGPVQDTPITGLTAANGGPQLDHNPLALSATVSGGSNVSYEWNPGDGSGTVTGQVVTHTYTAPGSYTAVVTATNSVSQAATSTEVTVNRSAWLSGRVWDDVDGDGSVGPGESTFSGETIRAEQNGLVFTTTTGSGGTYVLRGLRGGSYTLFSPAISGYKPFGASVRVLSMPLTGASVGQWLPYRADSTGVRGRAWLDDNLNGRWDPGEMLLTNHPVSLMVLSGPHPEYPRLTDDNGLFRFDLASTDGPSQRLSGDTPAGYEPLSRTLNGAQDNGYTSNLNFSPGGILGCVTPSGGAVASGLTVTLRNSSGQDTATTTTDSNGCYLFTAAEAEDAVTGRLTPAGSDLVVGPESQPAVYLGTPLRIDWQVTAPATVGIQLYSIDGVPYFSAQHDFSGYEVHLATSGGLITTTTNVDGHASFENIVPGLITATIPLSGDNVGVTPSRIVQELPPGTSHFFGTFELGTHGVTAECRTPPVPGQEPNGRLFPCTVELRYLLETTPLTSQTLSAGEQFFYQPTTPSNESYNTIITITPDLPNGAELAASDSFFMRQGGTFHFRYPYFLPDQVAPISGEVWTDSNANGTREATEGAAVGFTVELLDSSFTVVETTTTDSYGRYQFHPDSFGRFRVRVAPSDTLLPTTQPIHFISRDEDDLTGDVADFGIALLSEGITGRVRFSDLWRSNASGVTVQLFDPNDTTAPLESDVTGPTGHFSFDGLLPDDYLLRVLPPDGGPIVERLVTASISGTPQQEISLSPEANRPTVFVFADENGNEVADPGEGLPGVSVAFDQGVCGNVIDVNETDGDGFAPSDLVFPNGGCARITDGLPEGLAPARPDGVIVAPYDGGIVPLRVVGEGTLQLRPFWDRNGNGQQDAGEPLRLDDISIAVYGDLSIVITQHEWYLSGPTGTYNIHVFARSGSSAIVLRPNQMTGVISSLTENSLSIPLAYTNTLAGVVTGPNSSAVSGRTVRALDENGAAIATAVTGVAPVSQPGGRSYTPPPAATGGPASAPFSFNDLPPGTYRLQIADAPPGTVPFGPVDVVHDPAAPTNAVLRLVGVDSVSGVVYWDDDYDGSRDGGDPGTNFYDVVLLNDAGLPEETVTPAADGTFVFTGLQPGVQYALTVPDLYQETDSAGNWITESPGWFTTGSWPAVGNIGIGNYADGNPNSVAVGQVYVQNGTSRDPVAGATVGYYQLQGASGFCNAANPSILGQTSSDRDGRYRLPLAFVPNGSVKYCLVVLDAPGLIQNDLTVIADAAVRYNLPGGRIIYDQALNLDMDIKMRVPAGGRGATGDTLISWAAYRDDNLNGMWDAGEVPLTGAILAAGAITDTSGPGGSGVLTATVTGEQILSVTPPAGYAPVGPVTRTTWVNGEALALPPIGFVPEGAAYGILFVDKDGDGWPGSGGEEYGLGGVTVTVSGPVVTTTVTTPDGRFSLRGLPDGNYTISAAVADGYAVDAAALTVAGGAGIVRLPAQSTRHLSGALYHDWDGDGVRLGDEALVTAVPLTVTVPGVGSVFPLGGSLLFWDVAPGNYAVEPVWEAAAPAGVTLGTNSGGGFQLPAVSPGLVRGVLWLDANADGLRQPWETPLSGIPVTLNGDSVVTDASGRYTFVNVVTGTHTLGATLPDGLAATIPAVNVTDGRGAAAGIPVTPEEASFTIYLPAIRRP